jgi:hypothetical protein
VADPKLDVVAGPPEPVADPDGVRGAACVAGCDPDGAVWVDVAGGGPCGVEGLDGLDDDPEDDDPDELDEDGGGEDGGGAEPRGIACA